MSPKTFKGGIHPGDFKNLTEKKPAVPPSPCSSGNPAVTAHRCPCKPLVAVGDEVKWQKSGQ